MESCLNAEHRGYYLWIGGQRQVVTDKTSPFLWKAQNTPVQPFSDWHAEEPNNWGGLESCMNVWPMMDFQWNDQSCATQMCFICQMRA